MTKQQLRALIQIADKALNGDSNDAEHDALWEIRDALARYAGVVPFEPAEDKE